MKNRRINFFLLIGLVGTVTFGSTLFSHLHGAFWGERTIWWTPRALILSLEETRDRFELYIAAEPLHKRLAEGTLLAVDTEGEPYRIAADRVGVRMNNWDRVQASFLKSALPSGFLLGFSVALFLVGLGQVVSRKRAAL